MQMFSAPLMEVQDCGAAQMQHAEFVPEMWGAGGADALEGRGLVVLQGDGGGPPKLLPHTTTHPATASSHRPR